MDGDCFPKRSVSVSQVRYSGLVFVQSANATCSNEYVLLVISQAGIAQSVERLPVAR